MYKVSYDIKKEAKEALRGRWKEAIILNIVPIILAIGINAVAAFMFWTTTFGQYEPEWYIRISSNFGNSLVEFIFSIITIGISFSLLDVIRNRDEASMAPNQAFRLFNSYDFVPIILINLLILIFTTLWTFLLVIPGIVKGYAYSQSNFIYKDLSTHTDVKEMNATAFIDESRQLMDGHKGRLFWLDFSFIGWHILGGLTLGLAYIFITPYIATCHAVFYDDLAKDKYLKDASEEVDENEDVWESF
ncbi:DUF975 family protein [Vagococcus carniphilus]|nr:DUF975 family protein [Vagococcus carniphilus]QNN73321.1 DUF975 family protein [Vagococcus carniphilus]